MPTEKGHFCEQADSLGNKLHFFNVANLREFQATYHPLLVLPYPSGNSSSVSSLNDGGECAVLHPSLKSSRNTGITEQLLRVRHLGSAAQELIPALQKCAPPFLGQAHSPSQLPSPPIFSDVQIFSAATQISSPTSRSA